MDRRFDPRSIVTPYAFAVHPDLLGRPLATPWQRLGAILVDLVVIGFISQIGLAPLAIGSTVLLFWLAFRKPGKVVFGKGFRIAVGCLGFLVLTATVLLILWFRYGDFIQDLARESGVEVQVETGEPAGTGEVSESEEGAVGLGDVVQGFRGVVEIRNADTREEAQALMDVFVQGAFDSGLSRGQIRDLLGSFIPEDATWAPDFDDMVDQAMGTLAVSEALADENPPVEGGADPEEPSVALGPAATDSIDRLSRGIQLAQEELADTVAVLEMTKQALEAERNRRAFSWFWEIIDDLSVGSLWGALYFTITLAWWGGTSVGKRLFRIRVVMIDKRPLNWWLSFERVGGYAAGFATGLLGFAQIFWDPNRQAIHDKVSETFVIQDGRDPVPGPWIEEGKTQWTRGRHETQETPGV
jgi:hypothetical protein